jgi:hypothetical protein
MQRALASRLTAKLRGRELPSDQSRRRTIVSSARGNTTDSHGTLQRLLAVSIAQVVCSVRSNVF